MLMIFKLDSCGFCVCLLDAISVQLGEDVCWKHCQGCLGMMHNILSPYTCVVASLQLVNVSKTLRKPFEDCWSTILSQGVLKKTLWFTVFGVKTKSSLKMKRKVYTSFVGVVCLTAARFVQWMRRMWITDSMVAANACCLQMWTLS